MVLFILLTLLVKPVYAGSSFQYSRVIKTDNLIGYKSVILDKVVHVHSNHLNDLRVINEKDEEVPYFIASVRDALSESEKASFILSEKAQYSTSQDRTDSIITIQVNQLNAFSLELDNTDGFNGLTYGLFGIKDDSTYYLSEGELLTTPADPTMIKSIEWTTSNPSIDRLRLILHNQDRVPINLKSVTIKYHLDKLVFKDPGNGQLTLRYGNETLRSPIYENMNYKDIVKGDIITPTELGTEVTNPANVSNLATLTKYRFFSKGLLTTLVLLMLLGVGHRLWKKKT